MRVHELAKDLNITSKELIEKANAALGLSLKSHSSTVGDSYIDKIKALYKKDEKPAIKPKAFIVKKQKPVEVQEQSKEEIKSEPVIKTVSKLEIVRTAPKPQFVKQDKPKQVVKVQADSVSQKPEQPKKQSVDNSTDKLLNMSLTRKNFAKQNDVKEEKQEKKTKEKPQKPVQNQAPAAPIKRHIISQDMYNNQGRGNKKKKTEHGYNNKQQEQ